MEELQTIRTPKRKRNNSDKGSRHLPVVVKDNIKRQFERKVVYHRSDNEESDTATYTELTITKESKAAWEIPQYMEMKKELNDLKNNLNDKNMITWHEHTRSVNLAGYISQQIKAKFRPEMCTQAWCKFYEIASEYLKVDSRMPFFSVHLCEAPGAFVTSLNHYLLSTGYQGNWSWLATTLNPYFEGNSIRFMIDDDKFIRSSHGNWYFGVDGTGNLMSAENLAGLVQKLQDTKVDLVTADGSVDCQDDPAEQEGVVSRLQYCETITAMHVLAPGGTFVIKMFTMFECRSVSLMYLLNSVFDKVNVFKPCTSKGGNSEAYVVCQGYKGREYCKSYLDILTDKFFGDGDPEGCIFDLSDIPDTFFQQHTECVEFFKDSQMTSIQRNLDLYKDFSEAERSQLDQEREYCAECFFSRYRIQPMIGRAKIMRSNKRNQRRPPVTHTKKQDKTSMTVEKSEGKSMLEKKSEEKSTSEKKSEEKSMSEEISEDKVVVKSEEKSEEKSASEKPSDLAAKKKFENWCHFAAKVRLEGKFMGSFQERKLMHGLPWQQKVFQFETFEEEVSLEDNSLWIKSMVGPVSEGDVGSFSLQHGRPVARIHCSRFCHSYYIARTQEILDNVQWLRKKIETSPELTETIVKHLLTVLKTALWYINPEGCTQNQPASINSTCVSENDNGSFISWKHWAESCERCSQENTNINNTSDIRHVENSINCNSNIESPDLVSMETNSKETDSNRDHETMATANIECDKDRAAEKNGDSVEGEQASAVVNEVTADEHRRMETSAEQNGVEDGPTSLMCCLRCCCRNGCSEICGRLQETASGTGSVVRWCSVSSCNVDGDFEIVEQKQLCDTVMDILKTCRWGETVVIEMGTSLSRLTAGLVYLLYRSFLEVGFVHHHGNLLRRHLVCVGFQHCPASLHQYLTDAWQRMSQDHTEAVLEIVPLFTLLEDTEFTSFLRISNTNLLQSLITTVINQEQQTYSDQQQPQPQQGQT